MPDGKLFVEILHGPEEKRFVVRAFNEELKLRVLVGDAQRGRGCLAIEDFAAAPVELLAETFTPELFEPECEFPQRLRIRE